MAGAGYKLFATGDVLTAAQVNTYLNEQTVMVFADSAARTTALSGVLAEGMMSYLQDTDSVEVYDSTSWTAVGGGGLTSPLTTKGDVWGYSTTDARIPVGANGTVLTSDSAETLGVKWAAPAAGGATTLITRSSFSNVATVDYDSVFTTDYGSYLIIIEDIGAVTDSDDLHFQLRYGSTTQTGSYYSTFNKSTTASATYVGTASSGSSQWVATDQIGNTTGYPVSGWLIITNANGTDSLRIGATGQFVNNSYNSFFSFNGTCSASQAWSGFRVKSSSTNITGTIAVYGLKV